MLGSPALAPYVLFLAFSRRALGWANRPAEAETARGIESLPRAPSRFIPPFECRGPCRGATPRRVIRSGPHPPEVRHDGLDPCLDSPYRIGKQKAAQDIHQVPVENLPG